MNDIFSHPSLNVFRNLFKEGTSCAIADQRSSVKAFFIAQLLQVTKDPILILSEDPKSLQNDLQAYGVPFLKEFVAWEVLPAEEIDPSADIVGQRLNILQDLTCGNLRGIFVGVQAFLQRVIPQQSLSTAQYLLKEGENYILDDIIARLGQLGYRRTDIAQDKGEYALRAGLLDIFPPNAPAPYRLEFFGETLSSLRRYDPFSQRSIEKVTSVTLMGVLERKWIQDHPSATLLDYFPKNSWIIFDDIESLEERYIRLIKIPGAICPTMISFDTAIELLQSHPLCFLTHHTLEELSPVERKKTKLSFEWMQHLFTVERPINPCLCLNDSQGPIHYLNGLSSGFFLQEPDLRILCHLQRAKIEQEDVLRLSYDAAPADGFNLSPQDLVVHYQHGIGKYLGTEVQKNYLGIESEFLVIEYQNGARLLVPMEQMHLVSKYIGACETVTHSIHALNSQRWKAMRQKAEIAIAGYARDLLRTHAMRSVQEGFDFGEDSPNLLNFEMEFPWQETKDQAAAIATVKNEMHSKKCMDRLICGDVGYGKTEVAMRAAFKAVMDGKKQVAVLVPTTLLAQQHGEKFAERMQAHGIQVATLSRLTSTKEAKTILQGLRDGAVNIIIGTHRLLSADIQFHNLGLVIIDEEQRFGVRHKEALKRLVATVDCLTLSATPIPRTLYMSLISLKDLSPINTPPANRLPVKTILTTNSDTVFQQGLMRELARGGQAFVIHNRIETIYQLQERLEKLVPSARICVAHGQMDPHAIEAVILAFRNRRVDILIATTILESGIDIPNANTIFIDRADQFGMADLYQLRGRVGRSFRNAYCYLLVPNFTSLSEVAKKRLEALQTHSGYGGGLKIAMRDLEIRGAGNLLGTEQSGQVETVGFHLYCKLLKGAIDQLNGKPSLLLTDTKIDLGVDAKFDSQYIASGSLRLDLYQRIGEAQSTDEITKIATEVIDRFGKLPQAAKWLFALARLRLQAAKEHIQLIRLQKNSILVERTAPQGLQSRSWLTHPLRTPEDAENKINSIITEFIKN